MPRPWLHRTLFSPSARRGWRRALWGCAALVIALALTPWSVELPTSGWDKFDHVAAFAALAVCGLFAWRGQAGIHARVALGLLALGIGIEFAQTLVPGRMADWRDVVADAAGIVLGLTLASAVARRMERRRRPRPEDRT